MEWEIRRARKLSDSIGDKDFALIVFPSYEGLMHAAMVVAGRLAHLPDAVDATREVLEALAIPQILQEGGDGRIRKIQRGKVRFAGDVDERFPMDDWDG